MRKRRAATWELIQESHAILSEQNPMTLRQLFYQLVTRHVIPNKKPAYLRLSRVMTDARESGDIPYEWMVDRSKVEHIPQAWKDVEGYMKTVMKAYRKARWNDQPYHVELWLEKDTLTGSVDDICRYYGIPLRAFRGFGSTTKKWELAQYFNSIDKPVKIFYVGDWDPSGLDIERDLYDSLREQGAYSFQIQRIAIFKDDIADFNLPPLKIDKDNDKESRIPKFINQHGYEKVEADALPPNELRERLHDHILSLLNMETWEKAEKVEEVEKQSIIDIIGKWKELHTQSDTSIS